MTIRILKSANKTILFVSLIAIGFVISVAAQGNGTTASTSTPAAKQPLSPKDELMNKLRSSLKNPAEFTANLAELLNKYPYDERAASYIYSLTSSFRNEKNPETVRDLINQFVKNIERVPAPLKADIYRQSANALFTNKFYADAAGLSHKTIDLLDESAYNEFKRKQFEESQSEIAKKQLEKQDKEAQKTSRKPPQFNLGRAKVDFVGLKTSAYNTLGKSLWEQGKFVEAETAYRDSLAVKITKESALGIARAAEKNGKGTEALKYATVAALTGKLVPEEMNYFYSVYAKQHQGKTDGAEEFLNAEFRKSYRNPVKAEKYKKTANRSDRTVLVEFVTGAGCIPCIPFDYTLERVLEDYSSKDVALVEYHTHAPTMDPLGNNSADFRYKYYALRGAPDIFIDGKTFVNEGDYNGTEDDNKIQAVANAVFANLKSNLEIPADARIKLSAKRAGQKVSVIAEAGDFKNVSNDVTLHIALVENETAYSGENGLRFHLMVVRALAGDEEKRAYGFKVDPTKPNNFTYAFDVNKVVANNLAYYDTRPVEMMNEFLGRMGGKMPEGVDISFNFKYKKNEINSDHLSVVAYLQDNKTKRILQSANVNLGR